jgi:hypothetical protein
LAVRIDHGRAAQWIADPDVNALIAAKAWEKFEPIAHASEGEQMSMLGQVRRALAAVTAS